MYGFFSQLEFSDMLFEPGFNSFLANNDDVEDGNDDVNELKLTEFTYFLISSENYFCLN